MMLGPVNRGAPWVSIHIPAYLKAQDGSGRASIVRQVDVHFSCKALMYPVI